MDHRLRSGKIALRRRTSSPRLSLVVPVFNEADAIALFVERTQHVLDSQGLTFEILFVNDGSRDRTLDVLLDLCEREPRLRVVNLSRNFGKEVALSAGLDHADGDAVVLIDVDLQDPPELIPQFLEHWRKGYDVVYGTRISRRSDTVAKRASANWFYRLFNRLSTVQIPCNTGDFRLLDHRVVEAIRLLPERNRFMKGIFAWVGFSSVSIPYERPIRAAGTTKFSHWRLWNLALDGLVSFSTVPLRVWSYVGALIALLAFAYGSFIVIRTLILGIDLPGYASLLTTVLFLGGIQLLSVGVLGEYLGRIMIETKGRPLYLVEGIFGGTDTDE